MHWLRSLAAVGLVALSLSLAGCGPSPTASSGPSARSSTSAERLYGELGRLNGPQRRARLVELARAEGALDLYTSMTSEVADDIVRKFSEASGVRVNLYRAGSETLLQRILQEQKASFRGNDVVETNASELFILNKQGMLAPYVGARRNLVPIAGRFEGWTATRFNLFAPSWNTKLVRRGEQPKSWEDLADPKWNGKLSLEVSDSDWYLTLYEYWRKEGKTTEQINTLFNDIASGAKIAKGHTVQGELLSAGQFPLAATSYTYVVERAKAKGAPVDYMPLVEPVIARPNGLGLMKTAKHPAAALLFADWLLEEGQGVLQQEGLTPAIPSAGDPLKGVRIVPIDVKTLVEDGAEWSKRYEALLARGETIRNK